MTVLTYQDAVAEFRRLDQNIEVGQWRQSQLIWEQMVAGVPLRTLAHDTGKGERHLRSLYQLWEVHGHSPEPDRAAFADAYRMVETGSQTPDEASTIKDAHRAASAWSKLPPARQSDVALKMFRDPAAAQAATAALTATPDSAARTYQAARDAMIRHDREQRTIPEPPPIRDDERERIVRLEQLADDLIVKLADILDPDLDPSGQTLEFIAANLDALSDAYRQRLSRALSELAARVSTWEDRMLGIPSIT